VFSVIGDLFPPSQRARAQGLFGGVFGLSSIVGPTAGGFITDHWNWRWVFEVNIPVGIIAVAVVIEDSSANRDDISGGGLAAPIAKSVK